MFIHDKGCLTCQPFEGGMHVAFSPCYDVLLHIVIWILTSESTTTKWVPKFWKAHTLPFIDLLSRHNKKLRALALPWRRKPVMLLYGGCGVVNIAIVNLCFFRYWLHIANKGRYSPRSQYFSCTWRKLLHQRRPKLISKLKPHIRSPDVSKVPKWHWRSFSFYARGPWGKTVHEILPCPRNYTSLC